MNRSDLHWALSAVIPHAAKRGGTVGLTERYGWLFVYAGDGYTFAVARIPDAPGINLHLPASEATDLMRFVRPNKVAEQTEDLTTADPPGEFHVGLADHLDDEDGSEVYTQDDGLFTLDNVLGLIHDHYKAEVEWGELIIQPPLVAKFAKASRKEGDRLRIHPRRGKKVGSAVVTVGTDFLGAIAGMTYDNQGDATVASFLSSEGKAA